MPAAAVRLFPASTRLRAISTPSTSAPSFAAGNAVVPSPHPRSSTLSPFVIPSPRTSASPLSRMVAAMRVKSPFSQSALFGFMRSIYDRQADRAICEFCYENVELPLPVARQLDELRHVLAPSQVGACISDLAARSRDPTSERLKPIQSAHTEHDLAPHACHVRSRGAFPFYALLRGLAYSSARSACPPPRANAFGAYASEEPAAR